MFCRVRPLLPDESCSSEGKIISYPTSMEASGRGIELTQNGISHDAGLLMYACFSLFYSFDYADTCVAIFRPKTFFHI